MEKYCKSKNRAIEVSAVQVFILGFDIRACVRYSLNVQQGEVYGGYTEDSGIK